MAAEVSGHVSTVSTAWAVFSVIGGSLIGAAISAGMAYFTLRQNINAAKANRDEDRFELRKARGYALFFKMIRLTSDLHTLGKAVKSCFDDAQKSGFKGAAFQIVRPIIPLPDPVQFAPEEMALVLSIDSKLFNEMGALDELHKSTVALFDMYNTERTRIMERFGAKMEGAVGTTGLTEQEKNWLEPRAYQLNQLVELMLQRTEQDGKEAWVVLEKLHTTLEKTFNLKHKLERKDATSVRQPT
ncbi:hypothetical protein [Bradyrhizobium sp. STM 3557]|uniref:hypothetical protein n=1 Tax=Bradyrhizobium sp. STM 3557 TaxID=578920 RepID=UPI00388FC7D1